MNYPIWQLDFFGGGLLIAAIAVFHVYISHFAVGAGLFLVLAELKGYKKNDQNILDYVRKHARFFLLVSMVAGGMTGVGIWFTIALLNPAATSLLIHTFVFGWATEWVFFVIEIVALFLYYYTFGKISKKNHLILGWIYFGAAWMSLFVINGIINFMLTPGTWLENQNFWSGFFNPTFWPALAFRTFFALIIAGLFGLITATWQKNQKLRITMTRFAALWLLLPFAFFIGSAYWYKISLPPDVTELIFQRMPAMTIFIDGFLLLSPVFVLGGLLLAIKIPQTVSRPIAAAMLIAGLLYMGCFEFIREGGRHPYIIYNHLYSNSIFKDEIGEINKKGVLATSKWAQHKNITAENKLEAGRELYNILCLSCHSIDGPMHNIKTLTKDFTPSGLDAMINGMETIHPYMPPYPGTKTERQSLAYFIAYGLNGNIDPQPVKPRNKKQVILPFFNEEDDEYILLAWNTLGMHTMSDTFSHWSLNPPGNIIRAQLILRGETPEVVTDDVRLSYQVEKPFLDPARHSDFWNMAEMLFDKPVEKNKGVSGNGLKGEMTIEDIYFHADQLPVLPYPDQGGYDPYPVVTIKAKTTNGTLLATTKVTAPVSTEMGCYQCHGGQYKVDDQAGFTQQTAENILAVHDRLSDTSLLEQARTSRPVRCQECHNNESETTLNLSASLHGFHALFLKNKQEESCQSCHPALNTQSLRGIHNEIGLNCTNCHGVLEDHALSLLVHEKEIKKQPAAQLIKQIQPVAVDSIEEIAPRRAWEQLPDCLHCHVDFEEPETDTTFNQWTENQHELYKNRTDESGSLACAACHSSPHAIYPAANDFGETIHNLQPNQYQKNNLPMGSNLNCMICHTIEMEDEMHHSNMLRDFRNQ